MERQSQKLYADILTQMDPSGRLARIHCGDIEVPSLNFVRELDCAPFAPSFIPICSTHSDAYGAWLNPFSLRQTTYTRYIFEAPDERPIIASTPDDFIRILVITLLHQGIDELSLVAFLDRLDTTLSLTQAQAHLQAGRDSDQALNAITGHVNTGQIQTAVSTNPHDEFWQRVRAHDFDRAWDVLCAPGWSIEETRRALVLQDSANNEIVSAVARAWIAAHARWPGTDRY